MDPEPYGKSPELLSEIYHSLQSWSPRCRIHTAQMISAECDPLQSAELINSAVWHTPHYQRNNRSCDHYCILLIVRLQGHPGPCIQLIVRLQRHLDLLTPKKIPTKYISFPLQLDQKYRHRFPVFHIF